MEVVERQSEEEEFQATRLSGVWKIKNWNSELRKYTVIKLTYSCYGMLEIRFGLLAFEIRFFKRGLFLALFKIYLDVNSKSKAFKRSRAY